MTDPMREARERVAGDFLLRRLEYEQLGLNPVEEIRLDELEKDLKSRRTMRDALYVARAYEDDTDQREMFDLARRTVDRDLDELRPTPDEHEDTR